MSPVIFSALPYFQCTKATCVGQRTTQQAHRSKQQALVWKGHKFKRGDTNASCLKVLVGKEEKLWVRLSHLSRQRCALRWRGRRRRCLGLHSCSSRCLPAANLQTQEIHQERYQILQSVFYNHMKQSKKLQCYLILWPVFFYSQMPDEIIDEIFHVSFLSERNTQRPAVLRKQIKLLRWLSLRFCQMCKEKEVWMRT